MLEEQQEEQIENKLNTKNSNNLFSILGPTKTFFIGIIATVLVGSTIGFFVLLFFNQGASSSTTTDNTTKTFAATAGTNSTPANTAPPSRTTGAQPSGQIDIQPVTLDDHIRGDLDSAEVVIVEFSDTECPFCKRYHPTMQQVVDDYEGQVAWVYRHFPLDSLHSKARKEAEATECAAELGGNDGFWAYLDKLFETTPSNNGLDASQLPQIAEDVGLDATEFQTCLDSGKYADKIESQVQDATASGGNGTPYSVVVSKNGETIPISGAQPLSSIKSIIDALL